MERFRYPENITGFVPYWGREKLGQIDINFMSLDRFTLEIGKAGFSLKDEYDRRSYLRKKFGESGDSLWLKGVTDEISEHAFEYGRKDIIRFPPEYTFVDNKLFSVNFSEFGENLINPLERRGSVLKGFREVEKKLLQTENGFVIWVSPSGPLDIGDLTYDYSWVHIFHKTGNNVEYVSVKNDFTLKEHAQLLNLFLAQDNMLKIGGDEIDDIRSIMEMPVVADRNWGVADLPDLIDLMAFIRGSSGIAFKDKSGETRYFSEIREAVKNADKYKKRDSELVEETKNYYETLLASNIDDREKSLRIMGNYLLVLNGVLNRSRRGNNRTYSNNDWILSFDHLKELQKVGGCGAGIFQNKSTFTSRISEKSDFFECPNCHHVATGSVGNSCPNCHITKEQWIVKNKGQEDFCD